jgi:hypothetical protein
MTKRMARYSIFGRDGVGFETTRRRFRRRFRHSGRRPGRADIVEVEPRANARSGWCFANVDDAVAEIGGSRHHVWTRSSAFGRRHARRRAGPTHQPIVAAVTSFAVRRTGAEGKW